MNRRTIFKLSVLLFPGLLAGGAMANGFRLADQDAFATGRGEAFVATADNPSAVYYNPAGITQLPGLQARGGFYGICYDQSYVSTKPANAGSEYHSGYSCAVVPQFFCTCTPEAGSVTFGLGLYAPYGGAMSWPEDTGFRTDGLKSSLTYLTFNPVVAFRVLPSLSLAAGVMANYGQVKLEQGILANYNAPFYNFFRFKGCNWAVSYNGGVLWQPVQQLSFGATIRSPATFKMEGETTFVLPPGTPTTQHRNAHAYFKFPLTTTFGVSCRPTPQWNLEFNADYTDWSSMGRVVIYQQTPPAIPNGINQNPPVNLYWRESWMYSFGVTRYFDNGWHASAGYVYNESSVPDEYYAPLVSDLDRHFISAGLGHKGKRFSFDVAYQFGYGPPHTVVGSRPSSQASSLSGQTADGTYEFISHAAIVSVGMNF